MDFENQVLLKTTVFNGNNYHSWAEDIVIRLKGLNLHKLTTDSDFKTKKENETDPDFAKRISNFSEKDEKAQSLLLQSILKPYRKPDWSVDTITANKIWTDMKIDYGAPSSGNIFILRKQFLDIKWQYEPSLIVTINKLEHIRSQISLTDSKISDIDMIIQLLSHAPRKWESFVNALHTHGAEITEKWNILKQKLLDEEKRRNPLGDEIRESASVTYAHKTEQRKQKNNKRSNRFCNFCQRNGNERIASTHNESDCRIKKRQANNNKNNDDRTEIKPAKSFSFALSSNEIEPNSYYLDSGAEHHSTGTLSHLKNMRPCTFKLRPYGTSEIIVKQMGDIEFLTPNGDTITMKNVLYSPEFPTGLISTRLIQEAGFVGSILNKRIVITSSDGTILLTAYANQKYKTDLKVVTKSSANFAQTNEAIPTEELIHYRMAHAGRQALAHLANATTNGAFTPSPEFKFCDPCAVSKPKHNPFHARSDRDCPPGTLGRLDIDICGPIDPPGINGERYFLVLILPFSSKLVSVNPLESKSEATNETIKFIKMIERQTSKRITEIRSDNAGELRRLKTHCDENGIIQSLTMPYTSNQNPFAERLIQTVTIMATTMINQSGISKTFWPYAVSQAAYILNRLPKESLSWKTPYELAFGTKPDISKIRVFGSEAYVLKKPTELSKLSPRGDKGFNLGNIQNGYLILLDNERVIQSRDVTFNEEKLLSKIQNSKNPSNDSTQNIITIGSSSDPLSYAEKNPSQNSSTTQNVSEPVSNEVPQNSGLPDMSIPLLERNGADNDDESDTYHETRGFWTSTKNKEPKNLSQAMSDPLWTESVLNEMRGIIQNGSFENAKIPSDKKALTVKPVFTTKLNIGNSIPKFKTRIVARGYQQREGVDYEQTFAPVARHSSLRLILALTVQLNGNLEYYDVKQAYLNGPIDKEIYVSLPRTLNDIVESETSTVNPSRTYRLKKALYGLKQAGRLWNDLATDILKNCGYKQCFYENCLFVKRESENVSIILIYVDDILELNVGKLQSREWLHSFKEAGIIVQSLGFPSNFIGFQIIRESDQIMVNQSSYIERKIEEFGLSDTKTRRAPPQLKLKEPTKPLDDLPYLKLTGSLNWCATGSRPDISFVTSYACSFNQAVDQTHINYAKGIFKYLLGTIDLGIKYERQPNHTLIAYVDSDFASDKDKKGKRISVSGYIILLAGGPIYWKTGKQKTTAHSSTEAEIIATHDCMKDLIYFYRLLEEMKIEVEKPLKLYVDNSQAKLAFNEKETSNAAKMLEVKYFSQKEYVTSGLVELVDVRSDENIADMLTKALGSTSLMKLRKKSNLV